MKNLLITLVVFVYSIFLAAIAYSSTDNLPKYQLRQMDGTKYAIEEMKPRVISTIDSLGIPIEKIALAIEKPELAVNFSKTTLPYRLSGFLGLQPSSLNTIKTVSWNETTKQIEIDEWSEESRRLLLLIILIYLLCLSTSVCIGLSLALIIYLIQYRNKTSLVDSNKMFKLWAINSTLVYHASIVVFFRTFDISNQDFIIFYINCMGIYVLTFLSIWLYTVAEPSSCSSKECLIIAKE